MSIVQKMFASPRIKIFSFLLITCFLISGCSVGDDETPDSIQDFAVSGNSKIFSFTSPGDDSDSGEARLYLLRFFDTSMLEEILGVDSLQGVSEQEIEQAVQDNFDDAIQVPQFFSPSPAGTEEFLAVPRIDLNGQSEFYFSIATNDEVGNTGSPSNVVNTNTPLVSGNIMDDDPGSCLGVSAGSAEISGKDADEDDASEFVSDLIVGDPCNDRVYIFLGGADIIGDVSEIDVSEADITIIGNPGDSFGAAVSGIGNFAARTTFEEFIIGAPDANDGAGKAYVFFGREDLPEVIDLSAGDESDIVINGENPGDNFGFSFGKRGSDDIYIGAPGAMSNRGIVYRFDGDDLDEVTSAASANDILIGELGQGMFGYQVTDAQDLDRSSPNDFVVSAPGLGRVYVILDTRDIDLSQDLSDVITIEGNVGDRFGESMSAGFDIDGFVPDDDDEDPDIDRNTDVVVGAPGANNGAGAVFVYSSLDLVDAFETGGQATPVSVIEGGSEGDNFGASLEVISDINPTIEIEDEDSADVMDQDVTNADIVIGAPGAEGNGRTYVFFGREGFSGNMTAGDADITLPSPAGSTAFGSFIFRVEDINNDDFTDFAIGTDNSVVLQY